jgi:methylated-DNA-[protein]-cysteine S-methyltransferase
VTFPTDLGPIALGWSGGGLVFLRFARSEETTGNRVPEWVGELRARIQKHFAGDAQDFSDVKLDMKGIPDFPARVYAALRKIGLGRTTTYGDLAARAGSPGAARAVGTAMRTNPFMLVVPCHRVLGARGKLGGFSAPGGASTKRAMLAIERAAGAHNLPFDADSSTRAIAKIDKRLGEVIERVGPIRLRIDPAARPFDMLAKAILYQQLATPAARAIHGRFLALVGTDDPVSRLTSLSDAKLRGCGISRPKLKALRDLSKKTASGELPTREALETMSDDEIIASLTKVRGIGPWTVHMLLIFRLGRPDVWPVDDYGVRKAWAKIFRKRQLPKPKDLLRLGEKYRPWRSVASWYFWRALE